ncbi:hypothetical protein [uncultured Clostridium sp.]|uniref:hypothetical protein n=1 Tax=uncultured Clostridium sp. TaxID=59620 RepID=UPI003217AF23
MKTIDDGKDIFELVDSVPVGYQIWNIGKNMIDGYLPLVRVGGYDGCQVIGIKKAIKLEGAQIILEAVKGGQNTIESMERYIKRYKNAKHGTWSYRQVERMKRALPFMYDIKWN